MTLYEQFLKALEGPFEQFVKSDEVNIYLQTIGPAVTSEVIQDGVPYEFVIVSGYEEWRGNWGTVYDGVIRFGDEIHQIDSTFDDKSDSTMLLTPAFFFGYNSNTDEIEYRLGLRINNERVYIVPVVLQRIGDLIPLLTTSNSCVIHTGLFIDRKSAEKLGEQKVAKLTAYQQFLSTFWNIDDYLRKQNPEFSSDYDITIWEAVEAFSGRIVDQMLSKISCESPAWQIVDVEEELWSGLVTQIEKKFNKNRIIYENLILSLVKNLSSYMVNFSSYDPLEILLRKKINIMPYLIKNLGEKPWSTDDEVESEARDVIENNQDMALNYSKDIIDQIEKSISGNLDFNEIALMIKNLFVIMRLISYYLPLETLIKNNVNLRPYLEYPEASHNLEIYEYLKIFSYPAFKLWIEKVLEDVSSLNRNQIESVIQRCVKHLSVHQTSFSEEISKFFDLSAESHLGIILENLGLLIFDRVQRIRDVGNFIYGNILKNDPRVLKRKENIRKRSIINFTKQVGIEAVVDVIFELDKNYRVKSVLPNYENKSLAQESFSIVTEQTPPLIDVQVINKISGYLSSKKGWILEKALDLYQIALKNTPQLFHQEAIEKITTLFLFWNPQIREKALDTYKIALNRIPQFINSHGIIQMLESISYRYEMYRKYPFITTKQQMFGDMQNIRWSESTQIEEILEILRANFPEIIDQVSVKLLGNSQKEGAMSSIEKIYEWIYQNELDSIIDQISLLAWRNVLVTFTKILKRTPHLINISRINKILEAFDKEECAQKAFYYIIKYFPNYIEKTDVIKILEKYNANYGLERDLLKIAIIKTPNLIETIFPQILELFEKDKVRIAIDILEFFFMYNQTPLDQILRNNPQLMNRMVNHLLDYLSLERTMRWDSPTTVYYWTIKSYPQLISEEDFNRAFALAFHPEKKRKKKLEESGFNHILEIIGKERPTIVKKFIPKILRLIIDQNQEMRRKAIRAYITILKTKPEAVSKLSGEYLKFFSKSEILEVSEIILENIPEKLNDDWVRRIIETCSEGNEDLRKQALEIYHQLIKKCPVFINQAGVTKLIECMSSKIWPKYDALKAYSIIILNAPDFINQAGIKAVSELLSHQYEPIRNEAFKCYELILEKKPQLFNQTTLTEFNRLKSKFNDNKTLEVLSNLILDFIKERPEKATIKDIAEKFEISQEFAKDVLDHLDKEDLVAKEWKGERWLLVAKISREMILDFLKKKNEAVEDRDIVKYFESKLNQRVKYNEIRDVLKDLEYERIIEEDGHYVWLV